MRPSYSKKFDMELRGEILASMEHMILSAEKEADPELRKRYMETIAKAGEASQKLKERIRTHSYTQENPLWNRLHRIESDMNK